MKKDKLPKIASKKLKRIGRGPGSGKGKTSGRGTKGQNARSKLALTHSHYEGGQRPLIKRLPYRRGKGNSKISKKPLTINLGLLNSFKKGEIVDVESLAKNGVVDAGDAKKYGVKILGGGNLLVSLVISVPISNSAVGKITKAGGKIMTQEKAKKTTK